MVQLIPLTNGRIFAARVRVNALLDTKRGGLLDPELPTSEDQAPVR